MSTKFKISEFFLVNGLLAKSLDRSYDGTVALKKITRIMNGLLVTTLSPATVSTCETPLGILRLDNLALTTCRSSV